MLYSDEGTHYSVSGPCRPGAGRSILPPMLVSAPSPDIEPTTNGSQELRRASRIRILGPLEVLAGDEQIPLGGRRQREVLALLIARGSAYVPVEQLIDDVWGDESPPTARNLIQGYVSRLRKAIGADRIEGGSSGYRLRIDPSELDVTRFEALVRNARKTLPADPALAVGIFDDALSTWRG